MKINRLEIEIIYFESNDVISTSWDGGNGTIDEYLNRKVVFDDTKLWDYNDATDSKGKLLWYDQSVISSFHSDGGKEGVYIYRGNGIWEYQGTCNGITP